MIRKADYAAALLGLECHRRKKRFLTAWRRYLVLISRTILSAEHSRKIFVENSPRVYKALKDKLGEVLTELRRISEDTVSEELLETIRFIAAILGDMNSGEG